MKWLIEDTLKGEINVSNSVLELIECPHCGKKFILNHYSIYRYKIKDKTTYYCSYTCWRANEPLHKKGKGTKGGTP